MIKICAFAFLFSCFLQLNAQDYSFAARGLFDSRTDYKYEDNCNVIYDGMDENLDAYVKTIEEEHLFNFTPSSLKRQFSMVPLMSCNGNLTKIEGDLILKLNFKIQTENARTSYGKLENGAVLRIKLSNETTVYAYNYKKNKGRINSDKNTTLYRGNYVIRSKDLKHLHKHTITDLGVMWSQGYEEYSMMNLDFLQRQLKCMGYDK